MYTFIMDILDLMNISTDEEENSSENYDFGSEILKEAESLVGAYTKGKNTTENILNAIVQEITLGRNKSISSEEIAVGGPVGAIAGAVTAGLAGNKIGTEIDRKND